MVEKLKQIGWQYIVIAVVVVIFLPALFIFVRPKTSPYIVAIPVNQPSFTAPISAVFARAKYFVIYDIRTSKATYIFNNYMDSSHEVGLHITHLLLRQKVGIVIAKNVGPEPYGHLSTRGVEIYIGNARTVHDAIYKCKINALTRMNVPTGVFKKFF